MTLHPLAGKPAPKDLLIDVARLQREYYELQPDPGSPRQCVRFGASGHRGSSLLGTFTETHVLAITQAICDCRRSHNITGPLYLGKDTHALSGLAQRTSLEVLAANNVETFIQADDGVTPAPAISRAILTHNRRRRQGFADGIVMTPSHNSPEEGGFKYNTPNGGPADDRVTQWIQDRSNQLLRDNCLEVKRVPFRIAIHAAGTRQFDFVLGYTNDLEEVVDLDAIRAADLLLGVDPMGGAAVPYWERIKERYRLRIALVNSRIDPAFSFMTLDHDGKIRMDCSSPHAIAGLLKLKNRYSVALANDPDAGRHGIVTSSTGLMNPNHFLAVAIHYLLANRPVWPKAAAVGKTLVSSSILDRILGQYGRRLSEFPVGFRWFAPGLLDNSLCFGGDESAGASFLCMDDRVWTTDKDGILLALLAGEITARTSKDPGVHYRELTEALGTPHYTRVDVPATPEEKARLGDLSIADVEASQLAGEPILSSMTVAPANGAPIGGLKVVTQDGWFAARPSAAENVYRIYAESFAGQTHLAAIVAQARQIVDRALARGGKGDPDLPQFDKAAA